MFTKTAGKKIRIGIIGCGSVSELHVQGIQACENAELTCISDVDPVLLRKREIEWNVKGFDTTEELLASDIDAAFILTNVDSHSRLSMAALNAGKHVLLEKPVANTLEEIEGMIKLANANGLHCMPAHNYIYSDEMIRLRKNINSGNFGRIGVAWILYHIQHDEKFFIRYPGIIRQIGTHLLYVDRFLFGDGVPTAAITSRIMHPRLNKDEQCLIVMKRNDQSLSNLFASFVVSDNSSNPWTFTVKVLGTKGSAQISWQDCIFDRQIGTFTRSYDRYEATYEFEIDYFINQCILNNKPPLSTLEDARIVLETVIQAELLSATDHTSHHEN
ncbi:MAG TPA: Gfo/Idh/MocA family oxidoreductase [Chryseolinea sp.]|nr:Gfo/Idh/MocA family oxidoreductase [Chryseolinea sp.]